MDLRQSTERKVRVGPFVDVTNGYEPETGITLGAADEAEVLKAAGAATTDISGATWSAVASCDGWYDLTLTIGYTDTLGDLAVVIQDDSVCLPVFCHFKVVTQNYWDSMYSTDKLEVDVTQIGGVTQSATDLKDFADAGYDPGTNKITGTADMRGTDSALTDKTGFALSSTGADLILKNSTFALAIADAIWDEILTGATHNIASSAGRRVRQIGAYAIHDGTAQAGNSVEITFAVAASAIDGTYNRNLVVITGGTGSGQTRTIIDYDGSTKIAIADREWRTNPDATSEYQVVPDDTPLVVDQGIAQAGSTSSTIKLRAYASATNDIYLCNIVILVAGTGRGQARLVGAYDGTSKVVTLCGDNWVTTPDDTSVYVMIPYGATCTSCVGDDALAQINAEIGIAKNVALPKFDFYMVLSSDHVSAATGKTVSGEISKEGGTFAAITNSITEVSDGMYTIASGFTQTEMNADVITLKFTETDCDQRIITIYTT